MRLSELSHNQPAKRYVFAVRDSAGDWGDVEVSAHEFDTAKWKAIGALSRLEQSALRVGFTVKLTEVRVATGPRGRNPMGEWRP